MNRFPSVIFDLACGNGRDAAFFADHGVPVIGADLSKVGIASAQALACKVVRENRRRSLVFLQADLTMAESWQVIAQAAASILRRDGRRLYYGRFLLHALPADDRTRLLQHLGGALRPEDIAVFEFRTPLDAARPKAIDHRRWYVDPAALGQELAGMGMHARLDAFTTRLAVWGDEDPHVARVTVTRVLATEPRAAYC
jgi:SAM-dependent methyltransferase